MTDRLWLIHQPILSDVLIPGAETDLGRVSRMQWSKQVDPEDRVLHLYDVQGNKSVYMLNTMVQLILTRLDTPGAIAEALNIEGNIAIYDNRVDH
jgi:hypothetical protein